MGSGHMAAGRSPTVKDLCLVRVEGEWTGPSTRDTAGARASHRLHFRVRGAIRPRLGFGDESIDVGGPTPSEARRLPQSRWLLDLPGRAIERLESERACWVVLGVAMALSAGLALRLTRGATFNADEFLYFLSSRGFDPRALLSPHGGHLIAVPRLIYATVFRLFGPDYLVFRLLEVLGIALAAGLFYAVAKRRVGALAALAPSVLLLFLGSAHDDTLDPLGITHVYCVAAGLGALLALERDSRRGDLAACALLVVSVATFSYGLAFLGGVAVSVLLRGDRWRRAWIVLIPLALYGAWLLVPNLPDTGAAESLHVRLSNVLLIPNFFADAAAAVAAALAGLSYDFSNPSSAARIGVGTINSSWGYLIAGLAAAALALRLRRDRVPVSIWTSLAILFFFWVSVAVVAGPDRNPDESRYIYVAAVVVLLVATDALAGIRVSRGGLVALFAVTAFALATNIAQLRIAGSGLRSFSANFRPFLTGIELARDRVDPGFFMAGAYLAAVDRNGSFAFSIPELRSQPESVRKLADSTLVAALRLGVAAAPAPPAGRKCLRFGGHHPAPPELAVRPPGILLRSASGGAVTLGRFAASPSARVGSLSPGRFAALQIPADRSHEPWHVFLSTTGPLTICELGSP
jgi:hypothetical protein